MTNDLSIPKVLYGIFYGGLIAMSYLFLRMRTHDGGLLLFGLVGVSIFILHTLIWPRHILQGFFNPLMLGRGLLYGTTQCLILKAQSHGFTSTTLVASSMGSVFGVVLGRLILREKIRGIAIVAVLLCFTAVFMNPVLILKSYWGVLGGFTQGLGFVMSRFLMVKNQSMRQSIATGFGVGSALALFVVFLTGNTVQGALLSWEDIGLGTILGLSVQYGFFQLYKMLDAQRASLLTLTRMPWAMLFEYALIGTVFGVRQLLASGLIVSGAICLILDARIQRSRTTPIIQ